MTKLKLITLKIINILATVTLVGSTTLALLGFISATDLPWIQDILPGFLTSMDIQGTIATSLGFSGVAGGIGLYRTASREVKRVTQLNDQRNETKLRKMEEKYEAEIEAIRNENQDFYASVTTILNNNTSAIEEQNKILIDIQNYNKINALRNSRLAIIPKEERELYKEYLQASASNKEFRSKRLNVTINNITEEIKEEPKENTTTEQISWKL